MKLHLPSSLRSALLSCLAAAFVFTTGSGMLQAGEQELTFNGATLNWTTAPENQVFTAADSSPAAFAPGDNVYFTGTTQVTLGEDIAVGILGVETGVHVNITPGAYALEAERIELSGTLDYGSALHIGEGQTLAVEGADSVLDSALVLQDNGAIEVAAVANLNNNSLSMQGGTALSLDTTGDGRVYNLFTGVSSLLDAQGNTLVLNTTNNAVSNYFDTTRPGTGFWAGATLQLTTDGTLQLVRHSDAVKAAVEFTTPQSGSVDYSYYDKVAFNDISSSSSGGAIYGGSDCTITLSDNGSVTFCGNSATASASGRSAYGGAIYGGSNSTITLSNNGSVTFCGNSATASVSEGYANVYGGAICGGSNSTITLSNNGSVTFCGNSATASVSDGYAYVYGGAIYGSTIILDNNKSVCFCENGITVSPPYSSSCGSAIYGKTVILNNNGFITFHKNYDTSLSAAIYGSSVTISNNSEITFSENASAIGGGTISLSNNTSATFLKNTLAAIGGSTITINGCNSLTFSENTGCAIRGTLVTLHDNETVIINKNIANSSGGAIKGALEINNNTTTLFVENKVGSSTEASSYGGAISSNSLLLEENQSVNFSSNKARAEVDAYGGAIHGSYGSCISMKNNGTLSFNSNEANAGYAYGGAISASFGTIELYNNESVRFENNTVVSNSSTNSYGLSCGGAIDSYSIIIRQSNTLVFKGNQATASTSCSEAYTYGGAIYGSNIELSNNDYITFDGNRASATSSYCALGGAIHGFSGSNIQLNNNGNVIFSGNEASSLYNSYGGAISGTTIKLNNNTSLSFSKNKAKGSTFVSGGALDGENIKLCNNGTVSFDGNSVTASTNKAYGGAIYNYGALNIVDNESVLFEKNAEITDGSYRLRSIYAEAADIHLSVANGNSIEFRDSVYIDSGSTVYLNADYTNSEGNVIKQEGDIIFTGAYTETHLNELLTADGAGRTATAEEIANSRTSEMHGKVSLYGGTLRVEEQAVLKTTAGLDVAAGSNATVKVSNAALDAGSRDINVGNSGTLMLMNGATVKAANINITNGATFAVVAAPAQEAVATFSLREAVSVAEPPQSCLVGANLTFEAGSTLVADGVYFSMAEGSTLTFKALTGGDKINLVLTLGAEYSDNDQVVLFSDVDVVRFILDGVEINVTDTILANTFFTGAWVNDETTLSYDSSNGTISVQHLNTVTIPEPTTATLSLLALAALAARRRRK